MWELVWLAFGEAACLGCFGGEDGGARVQSRSELSTNGEWRMANGGWRMADGGA